MGTWMGAKRYVIPADGDYGEIEPSDDEDDFDEDEAIVVQFWVGQWEDDDAIEVETNGNERMALCVAPRVAEAITKLLEWSKTKAGIKEIARTRKKLDDSEKRWAAKAKKERATETGSDPHE